MSTVRGRAAEEASGIVAIVVTGIWMVALMTGQGWWLPFMLFGYIVLVPLTAMLIERESEEITEGEPGPLSKHPDQTTERQGTSAGTNPGQESKKDALEVLRDRYARGELSDEEFERKVERLIETESLDMLEADFLRSNDPERELERETES